jgi:CNT family concentrative nucleoside transporter
VNALLEYAEAGSQFLFGPLGAKTGPFGVVFAFQVLPIVIFIAALFAILYQIGVMQHVVRGMAVAMQRIMARAGASRLPLRRAFSWGRRRLR